MAKLHIVLASVLLLALAAQSTPIHSKIQTALEKSLDTKSTVNVFVSLQNGATSPILRAIQASPSFRKCSHGQKTTQVAEALRAHASFQQMPLLNFLQSNFPQVEVKPFWIVNQVFLKDVNRALIETLATLEFVEEIIEEPTTHISGVFSGIIQKASLETRHAQAVEWGLVNMRVPEVWNMTGNTGQGLVIGNIDTGVRGSHVLLSPKWVGLENHGWLDPEGLSAVPHDVFNHGTHTMGMLVGDNGIGIVQSATWLACKGYQDNGTANAETFITCCEYMLCPTDHLGNNPDCTKAPHAVSNSWGFGGGQSIFTEAIHAWNVAGIVSSFSAGNEGLGGCGSIRSPADQPEIAAVGATDFENSLAYFSSLGPSYLGLLKPEISAPGVSIYSASASSDTAMMYGSGTSMSCPSTSGVMALLKNQDREIDQHSLLDILQRTSRRNGPTSGDSCEGVSDDQYPNNHVGHGIIDAYDAVLEIISRKSN